MNVCKEDLHEEKARLAIKHTQCNDVSTKGRAN